MSLGRANLDQALNAFTDAMRHELLANDRKGCWTTTDTDAGQPTTPTAMLESLLYHAAKLAAAIHLNHPAATLEYAADVANEAMMTADIADALATFGPAPQQTLLRDVVRAPAIDGTMTAWAEKESDEASGASAALMHLAKNLLTDIAAIVDAAQASTNPITTEAP